MSQQSDQGVTPQAGSGHSAEPEPCSTVSAVPASVPNAVADKLDAARALIEKGWCQGQFKMGDCYCLYGAMNAVITGDAQSELVRDDYFAPLVKAIDPVLLPWELAAWNDAPERTQAEVVEAFRKAAELARQEQVA